MRFPAEVKITHPVNGQEFTLTLYGVEQTRHSFANIGAEDFIYPAYCQTLSYGVSPSLGRDLFEITDCADSDQPRRKDTQDNNTAAKGNGPTAVFMAGKNPEPGRRSACSSLHFKPFSEVQWRAVFQVKDKEDMEVTVQPRTLHLL